MPNYYYICEKCAKKAAKIKGSQLTQDDEMEHAVFETKHSMFPSESELAETTICPRCNSNKTKKIFHNMEVSGYVRGNGYLDKAGCHRDMNLFKLTEKDPDTGESLDPYHHMRQPGETDELKSKLKQGDKPKPIIHDCKPT